MLRMLSDTSVMISAVIWLPLESDEGAEAGDRLADDQVLHLEGALVGVERLSIGEEAADIVIDDDAVAAVQFARPGDSLAHPRGGKCLGQRCVLVEQLALFVK